MKYGERRRKAAAAAKAAEERRTEESEGGWADRRPRVKEIEAAHKAAVGRNDLPFRYVQ